MLESFGTVKESKISKLEKKLNITLPNDYRAFLAQNNGGSTEGDIVTFAVQGIEESVALDALYGIGLEEDLDIEGWCDEYEDELLDHMIIIGNAMESGMILLINQDDWKGIYYWDDSLYYEQSTEEECIYKIADSFDEFMSSLVEEESC